MARRDYKLNVIADISKYQAEFAKLPGYTDRMAARAGERLERRISAASAKAAVSAEKAAQRSSMGIGKLQNALSGLSPAASRAASGIAEIGALGGPALAGLVGPVGLAVAGIAALGAGAYAASARMSELVDEAQNLAEVTGLNVETTQALSFALESGGSSINNVRSGLVEFTKRMADASAKGGEAKQAFDDYGISIEHNDGRLRDVNAVFRETLQVISDIEDPTARAAARTRLFSAEAARAIAAIDPDKLRDAQKRTEGLSDAIRDAANSSAAWDAASADLSAATDELSIRLGSEFAEDIATVTSATAIAVRWTASWSDELRDLIHLVTPGFGGLAIISDRADDITDWWYGVEAATQRTRELRLEFAKFQAQQAKDTAFIGPLMSTEQEAKLAKDKAKREKAARKLELREQKEHARMMADARVGAAKGEADLMRELEAEREAERIEMMERAKARHDSQLANDLERIQARDQAEKDLHASIAAYGRELDEQRTLEASQESARQEASFNMQVSIAESTFHSVSNMLSATAGERKKAIRAAAIAERAAAIFSIGVNTARAIQAALATVVPTVPAGVIAATMVGASGIAQIGTVLAQPLPKAHTGTARVGSSGGEYGYTLTGSEAVIQPAAADAIGRSTIDAVNKGMRPAGNAGGPAVVHFNGRSMARMMRHVIRADAALPREVVSLGSTVSMRTPYD